MLVFIGYFDLSVVDNMDFMICIGVDCSWFGDFVEDWIFGRLDGFYSLFLFGGLNYRLFCMVYNLWGWIYIECVCLCELWFGIEYMGSWIVWFFFWYFLRELVYKSLFYLFILFVFFFFEIERGVFMCYFRVNVIFLGLVIELLVGRN